MWKPFSVYLICYLVRPVCTKNLLNNLKCQSLLAFKTAVSKMGFVLMGNSKLSLEECTKPVCFFKIASVSPDQFLWKEPFVKTVFSFRVKKICMLLPEKNTEISDNTTFYI